MGEVMKSYEAICKIKHYDSEQVIDLKNEMKRAFIQQEKLIEKYKSVRRYAELEYKINNIRDKIEIIYELDL